MTRDENSACFTPSSGVTGGCPGVQRWGPHAWVGGRKNDHNIFASTFGKFIEGPKICNGWTRKAGISEIFQ